MRRNDEPGRRDVEKSESPPEISAQDKLGRFADYTTPAMKELLFYGDGKMRQAVSGPA